MKLEPCTWFCAGALALGAVTSSLPARAQIQNAASGAATAAGENCVSDLMVSQGPDGRWQASFSYSFAGSSVTSVIHVYLEPRDGRVPPPSAARTPGVYRPIGAPSDASAFLAPQRGRHQASVEIMRPMHTREALTTTHVSVELQSGDAVLSRQRIEQRIEWPDMTTWMEERQWGRQSNADLLKRAIHDIDAGGDPSSLRQARQLLERVLAKDPGCDQCHLELARIAMKSNWGPEGLRQAESYIGTARRLRPDGANPKILLGYVYAHQGRHAEAEALLAEAARSDTHNNWLWANWGELLKMQGRIPEAIEKYREAMRRPPRADGFDYARHDAYRNLLALLTQRKDFDGVEALYRQRAAEAQGGACDTIDYAAFMLVHRGNGTMARELIERELALGCRAAHARHLLGMAYYHAWSGSGQSPSEALLSKARIYLPSGANMVYLLASSDPTVPALRMLLARGEGIDQQDNARFNALSYAIRDGDLDAAVRLLKLGAAPDARVGPAAIPVAVVLVQEGNIDGIRAFRRAGVDFASIRHDGLSATEIARRLGDPRVIDAIGQSL